jgi:hypothetical protein
MPKSPKPPRIPQARDYLWQALRRLRRATARELAAVTERPKNAVQVDLRYLVSTGFVRVERAVYSLMRDTGVKPPMFVFDPKTRRLRGAVDRNTRIAYGIDGNAAPAIGRRANWMPKVEPVKRPSPKSGRRKKPHRSQRTVIAPYQQRLRDRKTVSS